MTSEAPGQNDQLWQPCPSGEVAALVENLRHQRRRRRLQRTSAVVCGLAVAGMIGLYAVPHPLLVKPAAGGISCAQVEALADEYIAGRLDNDTTVRIDEHLQRCEECDRLVTQRRGHQTAGLLPESKTQPIGMPGFAVLGKKPAIAW